MSEATAGNSLRILGWDQHELMRVVRLSATGLATVTTTLLLVADSPALAVATWESRQVEVGARGRQPFRRLLPDGLSLCRSRQPGLDRHLWKPERRRRGVEE